MKDRLGTVIYVGKARDLRKRVSQYFHPSRRMSWDVKFRALVEGIHDFDVHVVKGEAEALLLESRLIKQYKPRYNVSFRDDKRYLMLKVNLNDPIPRFALTRLKIDDNARYFGPFPSGTALKRTLELARHKFNLRGCKPFTPDEHEYKHCLYGHLEVCSAPCIEKVTREQYRMQVENACDFLTGHCAEILGQLEAAMHKAAESRDYERAAKIRDQIDALRDTTRKTTRYHRLPNELPLAIDPDRDLAQLAKELGLAEPPARIEGFDISNISGTFMIASMVVFRNGRPANSEYRRYKMKAVKSQNDFACMAEAVSRRYARLKKEKRPMPNLILIDGGKGQLSAATAELEELGLADIPAIGLAKEFEEIHRPNEMESLRLGLDNAALKLLQRVRDESHRFANTFNVELRLKKISESVLDEFPGIGASRKAALLKHFGSLQRLREATVEQISEVSGFGVKGAQSLREYLDARNDR
ncbi:MAG: excinuclease ABC subunit UvrC [Verrucomicrobia subdivision 3 bacterium]|nr:excinuclease ABC subunit UvrC [Limisphaerales bacterium]